MEEVQHYLSLPYTVSLRRDEDGDVVASIPELPGCVTHAETEVDALVAIKEVQEAWLERALKSGLKIPLPAEAAEGLPSGKWLQRVPRSLHRKLADLAKAEGVSLNQLVSTLLAEAVGRRTMVPASRSVGRSIPAPSRFYGGRILVIDPETSVSDRQQARRMVVVNESLIHYANSLTQQLSPEREQKEFQGYVGRTGQVSRVHREGASHRHWSEGVLVEAK
jgi:antitoxin HicB